MFKKNFKRIIAMALTVIMMMGMSTSVFAVEGEPAISPQAICSYCNKGTLMTTTTYTTWYNTGAQRKCTHLPQGYDLEQCRTKIASIKCSYCSVTNRVTSEETRWACHGTVNKSANSASTTHKCPTCNFIRSQES